MAVRLTDIQKSKIIADYVELQSYNAVAKLNGTTHQTVKRIIEQSPEASRLLQLKKKQNEIAILEYFVDCL